ncbi:MAG: calcium-translocating P-type ATPase, PMCA-type [Bacteroidaceae bacterium]|nr:calcium-translocating P-type ATPase, PMCA-type [Bacteroidaceae bacterium]
MKSYTGLTEAQVAESRKKHGKNILTPPAKEPVWKLYLEKFHDPLIIILLIAGVLSVGISCYEYWGLQNEPAVFFEPIGIFVAILLATGLGFYFEFVANKEFSVLNHVNDEEAVKVIRNSNVIEIARKDVVVGDIVILHTGDEVPADGELLEAVSLNIDESTLTGEPVCSKTTDEACFDNDATYPSNCVLRGTKVMEGHGIFEVKSVGDATENGKVFVEAQIDDSVKTPLDEQFDRLGMMVTYISYTIAALIIVGRLLHYFCCEPFELVTFLSHTLRTLMIAVTLIVVAVPEGLPMAVTLSLAYSMRSMLKTNNLVRKLHACETMGATTVICTDKTGTLTQNKMQVEKWTFSKLTPELAEGIAVNSTASLDFSGDTIKPVGNPTEGALLLWMNSNGYDYRKIKTLTATIEEVPFSTERKYMSTTVNSAVAEKPVTYTKGAPEIVFSMCKTSDIDEETLKATLKAYQDDAYRTLGFARDNHFLGVVAISDPVREDVPTEVKKCMDAGINVKIVTGDTPGTAMKIGREIGLWTNSDNDENIITGTEFAALSDEELRQRVNNLKIIARARPMDKKRLVEALQANNHIVAVTGDGTNDAPALNAAHVGLSMGDGTSVAKEASDITIIDNSFSSIGHAVMWGRSLYKNIQRFLLFQLTVNVSACLIVLVGAFMGTESPLTVTQMLWVNLIMDTFGAMALASLPPSPSVMTEKPRDRKAFILTKSMYANIIGVGVAFFLLLFSMLFIFQHFDVNSLTDILWMFFYPDSITTAISASASDIDAQTRAVTPYEQTLLFSIFVWTHFWYMFNARSFETGESFFAVPKSTGFWTIAIIIFVGQFVITELLPQFFDVVPMLHNSAHPYAWADCLAIIILSSSVLWIREVFRWISPKVLSTKF